MGLPVALHQIRKGLDLPIAGDPEPVISPGAVVRSVAIVAEDYPNMRPSMQVEVGDAVRRGQVLFTDKKTPDVRYTAPAAGTVTAVNRGDKRRLESVVIALADGERLDAPSDDCFRAFKHYSEKAVGEWTDGAIRALLIESGLWTALRSRPFGKVPAVDETAKAVFVTAMDTNPLAADPGVVLKDRAEDFRRGLQLVSRLTEGPTFVCKAPGAAIPVVEGERINVEEFGGPHPAGLPGTHIHRLAPVSRGKAAWWLNYQDVIAIGRLFATGRLDVERVVALCGPCALKPRLLRTRLGASLDELTAGERTEGDVRVVSGSVLSGRPAMGDVTGYLSRYDLQVTVLAEGRERALFGWAMPGLNKFSVIPAFVANLIPKKKFAMTTAMNGGRRAIVPIGCYERVMPLDIEPTFLLRTLMASDMEMAEKLGALELIEEDLALCSFVCPSKVDYGSHLRENLTLIEKEG